jgi:hypothetical protein
MSDGAGTGARHIERAARSVQHTRQQHAHSTPRHAAPSRGKALSPQYRKCGEGLLCVCLTGGTAARWRRRGAAIAAGRWRAPTGCPRGQPAPGRPPRVARHAAARYSARLGSTGNAPPSSVPRNAATWCASCSVADDLTNVHHATRRTVHSVQRDALHKMQRGRVIYKRNATRPAGRHGARCADTCALR